MHLANAGTNATELRGTNEISDTLVALDIPAILRRVLDVYRHPQNSYAACIKIFEKIWTRLLRRVH